MDLAVMIPTGKVLVPGIAFPSGGQFEQPVPVRG